MEFTELNLLQQEIYKALEQFGERAMYSETILAKKIRENAKIAGKNKAVLSLSDLEKVITYCSETGKAFYSLHLNSANDILIKTDTQLKLLEGDARKRRQSCEKSISIFTNRDFTNIPSGNKSNLKKNKRMERKSLNINSNFEDWDN